jgi:hypothetical protein
MADACRSTARRSIALIGRSTPESVHWAYAAFYRL